MESNSQGRKKHLVDGSVQKIAKTDEIVEEAVKDARENIGKTVEAANTRLAGAGRKKGLLARIADIFKK